MMQWDRLTLGRMAKELGFPRDSLSCTSSSKKRSEIAMVCCVL